MAQFNQLTPLEALVILIALFSIIIFLVWYFNHRAKAKERLLIIEKGVEPKDLHLLMEKTPPPQYLKIGIIAIGIALGTLFASLYTHATVQTNLPHFYGFSVGIVLLFGGLSMILANYVGNSKK